jgi:MFS family permease
MPPHPPADSVVLGAEAPRYRPGSPAAALAHRSFRWIFIGLFASNVGTWMQNFTLGALADDLTHKAWFIGLVTFAQLGPILLLSPFAGVLADAFDRKRLLITCTSAQAIFSVALAWVATSAHPSPASIVALVSVIGIAGACQAPAQAAILPALVGKEDLAGAVSLNSAQMNASRVVGPLAAGLLIGVQHPALIFLINAATYLFVIAAFALVPFDSKPTGASHEPPFQRLANGIRAAREDVVVSRVLVTVSLFSLCSLVFIYQLHPFSFRQLGGNEHTFTMLFSSFGLGAALGAIGVSTVLARFSRPRLTRIGLAGFAVSLGFLALQHHPWGAYIAAFFTGLCYFVVITALSTILQEQVDDAVRGRVMGLWMMGWAGLVPLGSLIGGRIIDAIGLPTVFVFGAGVALLLVLYARLDVPDDTGPIVPPERSLLDEIEG